LRPRRRGLRQSFGERPHQAAVAVSLFEEPLTSEGLLGQPVQDERIDTRADRFHEIAGETVSRFDVCVVHAEARIETHGDGSQSCFCFGQAIQEI
jgi:hypothetical protein